MSEVRLMATYIFELREGMLMSRFWSRLGVLGWLESCARRNGHSSNNSRSSVVDDGEKPSWVRGGTEWLKNKFLEFGLDLDDDS